MPTSVSTRRSPRASRSSRSSAQPRPLEKTAIALAVLLLGAGLPIGQAQAACTLGGATVWNLAGNGDWSTAGAWSPAAVPNTVGSPVCITNGTGSVSVTGAQSVGDLQIGAGNGLNISTGTLKIGGSALRNDGAVTVTGYLQLAHDLTLSGSGALTLAGGQIGTDGNFWTLTNQSLVQGFGVIGSNAGPVYQNLGFVNSGTVDANASGGVLSIQGTGGNLVNTGLLRASAGGTLNLAPSGAIRNAGGTISADGGTVNLSLGGQQMVQGGTLSTSAGGILQTVGAAGLDGATFGAITIGANSTFTAGAAGSGTQTFTTGVLNLASGSTLALGGALELAGATTLAGAGTVVMNLGQIGTNGNAYTLTNQATIRGSGVIGSNATTYQNLGIANAGRISADVAGQSLSIQGTGASFVNTGVLQAVGGATLTLATSAALVNGGGSIVASGAGSTVALQNQTVVGGTLATTAGGAIRTVSAATLDGSTVANGAIVIADGSTYTAGAAGSGTQTFARGTLQLGTGGAVTFALGGALELTGDTTLSGAGGVVSMNAGQIGTNGNAYTLTNNLAIQGSGTIGSNATTYQNLGLVNNGTIAANLAGQTLSIQGTGAPMSNRGTLSASQGGTLTLNTATPLNNASGTIGASGAGNTINLLNQTIVGGTLAATAGATMQTSGSATLDGRTAGAITFSNGSTYLAGAAGSGTQTFTTGALALGTGGGATIALGGALELAGDTTFSGTGGVVAMSSGQIGTNGNAYTLTNNATIQGSGVIGSNATTYQNLGLVNNGTIAANLAGQTLSVQGTGTPITNAGVFTATGGGILNLATQTPIDNSHGTIVASGAGSTVQLSGQTVQGGTLATAAGGSMQTVGSAQLDGATRGAITLAAGSSYTAAVGTLTSTLGTLSIAGGADLALAGQLRVVGDTTFGGGGTVTLAGGEIGTNGNAGTLTNQAVIQGRGLIGSNAGSLYQNLSVVNDGSIVANASGGPLTIGGTGTLSGVGTLQASGGALVVALAGPVAQGRLVVGGAGSTVNLGASNLTLSNDYTNAQSGSGNTFDRRAGVTGTGAIKAGGNAAQAVVGTGVTNGSSADPTLTIGNVRVGANTFGYAIANTGTTGPTLRGAIQTTANGASLTDARLSGAGVTASNFTAGAPGGSTGNLAVVFTAAGAGALAPLTGQVVNLRSNFENIADQRLHIVIGGNAAAYQAAAGALQTTALNFGTVQVGQQVAQNLVVRNTASGAAGFVEDLNAVFGASTGASAASISGTGSLSGITAGNASTAANGTMTVRVDTQAAGVVSGGITVGYLTAGAVAGVSDGLGTASVGSQNFGVSGTIQASANVVSQASPLVNTPAVSLGAARVGGAALVGNVSLTNQAVGGQQAALNATISGSGAPLTTSGSVSLLAPGATSTNQLAVGLTTGTAGDFTGANARVATLALVSDASNICGCAPNCQLNLASQQVTVAGKVYATAAAGLGTSTIDFGIVHVNDTVATRAASVTNTAAVAGLNDVLRGSFGGATGPFTATGTIAGLAAQATDTASFAAGVSTANAGVFTGTATASFASHDADLADAALGSGTVALRAQVNRYAEASFGLAAGTGTLSRAGSTYRLDLGNLVLGGTALSDTLSLFNGVAGTADLLSGAFFVTGADPDFTISGFGAFQNLAAGNAVNGLVVNFFGTTLGGFDETIVLHASGSNASGYSGAIGDTTLVLHGNVVGSTPVTAVPEPGTWLLMLGGLGAMVGVSRRMKRA